MGLITKTYAFGAYCFRISHDEELEVPQYLSLFEAGADSMPEFSYEVKLVDQLPELTGDVVLRTNDVLVLRQGELEIRYISMKNEFEFYGIYQEVASDSAVIYLLRSYLEWLYSAPLFISLLTPEKRCLAHNSLVLHSCYTRVGEWAILFSGASGSGKSTHANLWVAQKQAEVINGDRSLLLRTEEGWQVYGWPVCGSSGICRNEAYPLAAIVMMKQGKENIPRRLRPMEAFAKVYPQLTVNSWNPEAANQALPLIDQLMMEVPVFELQCDISVAAVECLYEVLEPLMR